MFDQEDFDGEIEFLDEDAEIVQQCVQNVDNNDAVTKAETGTQDSKAGSSRMLHEQEKSKRKRKDDDDSDYNPDSDILYMQTRSRKRRPVAAPQNITFERRVEFVPKPQIVKDPFHPAMDLRTRRKLQLKVPDYDDPLCLPVRALRKDIEEVRKLRNWNNMCLERFKHYDTVLKADNQPTVASKRIVVLKNLIRPNGKVETKMSAKLVIENKNGEKKVDLIESVLPKYREKQLLNIRLTTAPKKSCRVYSKDEVILTKEVHKEEESLVVYKPMESLSLVYKIFDDKGNEPQSEYEEEDRKYLKEVASCKMCTLCYQTSWRAYKTNNNRKILCTICKRPCISIYNMLAHLKSHPNATVRAYKKQITQCLASALAYHYKCKICDKVLFSIKALRSHVRAHKGILTFKCEVCNKICS